MFILFLELSEGMGSFDKKKTTQAGRRFGPSEIMDKGAGLLSVILPFAQAPGLFEQIHGALSTALLGRAVCPVSTGPETAGKTRSLPCPADQRPVRPPGGALELSARLGHCRTRSRGRGSGNLLDTSEIDAVRR